jgi:hypothetical protein
MLWSTRRLSVSHLFMELKIQEKRGLAGIKLKPAGLFLECSAPVMKI